MDRTGTRSDSCVMVEAEAFLADIGYRRYSCRSIELYRQAIRDLDRFLAGEGITTVRDVTTRVLESYRRHLHERCFTPAGEDTYLRAVKRYFAYLEARQQIFINPCAGLGPVLVRRRCMPVPTEEEMLALLAAPDTAAAWGLRTRAILEMAYSTGARLEELARMKHGDLDLVNGTIRIMGKGNRERVVPVGVTAMEWVRRYVMEVRPGLTGYMPGALWVKAGGRPLGSQGIGWAIRRVVARAGLATPLTPHGIRRACATHMLNRGAHPVQIQMLLGHASLKHLSQYLRITFREMKAVHERSRLGQ